MLECKDRYAVGVVGATGAVGREMASILAERSFPVETLRLLASPESAGETVFVGREELAVEALTEAVFEELDIALFSAGAEVSRQMAPIAAEAGCVVIDNSSAWRADPDVPLVVPEVNPDRLADYAVRGIVANPNCSTIQMVVVLKPIADLAGLRRVVVTTYQSVSGAGQKGIDELSGQVRALLTSQPVERSVHPHQMAFNCIPHIGEFRDDGYTTEEWKLVEESRRILEMPHLEVAPTAVRVPVFGGHSEALAAETVEPVDPDEVRQALQAAPGVRLVDDPWRNDYPMPFHCTGKDEVFAGRIRRDPDRENVTHLWIAADNVRKGAALNAVQIAELLVEQYA